MHVFTESWDAKVGSTPLNAHIDNQAANFGHESGFEMASQQAARQLSPGRIGETTMLVL